MTKEEKISSCLAATARGVICTTGGLIFLFLSWYAFRYTQYMPPGAPEFPVEIQDSSFQNLLAFFLMIALTLALMTAEKKLSTKRKQQIMRGTMIIMLIWLTIISFWWIHSADRAPAADQLYICVDAYNFMEGRFDSLKPGYYSDRYPQQLGMIALLELLFSFAGAYNYAAYEIVNALAVPCIAYVGYRIVGEITGKMTATVLYCLTMMGCLPLVFYTSWVYGEILSIFLSMLAVFLFLRYGNRKKWGYFAGSLAALSAAVLIRKNCLILAIAFSLVALVESIRKREWKFLVMTACALLIPNLAVAGVRQIYEIRSGISISKGLPASSWIDIGLQEMDGRYGWYYITETDPYGESEYDTVKADMVYRQSIRNRLKTFMSQPSYALHFFKQKQLSQWNGPLYQGYHFSQNYSEENPPAEDSLVYRLSEENTFEWILRICDRLQFVLYVGMLLCFLFAIRGDGSLLWATLPVMIIGGFFFSMIWEAKMRYIFPYYVAIFPMSAIGYQQCLLRVTDWIQRRKKATANSEENSNILPFQRNRRKR